MIVPPLLKQGDKAIIIAPSGIVPAKGVSKAIETLENWGLNVALGNELYSSHSVFAGSDAERFSDFQNALNDPSIDLVLCARGGYGITKFIDKLSFTKFNESPKWIVGFSDITAFHLTAFDRGICSIHGPMATSFDREGSSASIDDLRNLLFSGNSIVNTGVKQLRTGSSVGQLVGGNLALICDSLGTQTEIITEGKILVLEDVGEQYYRIDRMLNQLGRAGKLGPLKGLVIGSFSNITDGEIKFVTTVEEMINGLTKNYSYPVGVSMPIGHEPQNVPFVHGAEYILDVKERSCRLEISTKI
jgi:muramoyltetrapeptide carboxypeptidase